MGIFKAISFKWNGSQLEIIQASNDEEITIGEETSPVNDNILALHPNVDTRSEYERGKERSKRKLALGCRVQILRVLIRNKFKDHRDTLTESEYWERVEKYLDGVLIKFDYNLEEAIDHYRSLFLDENFDLYGIPISGMVACNDCLHFIPDQIGDGAGVGQCGLGITWTKGLGGRMPLYRYIDRRCDTFSKLQN
jgi:hypothetical protein